MASPEYNSVVRPILQWIVALPGAKAIKVKGDVYSERGTPDIVGSISGRAFVIEAKEPGGGRVERIQYIRLRQWAAAGAITGVVQSLKEAQDLLLPHWKWPEEN